MYFDPKWNAHSLQSLIAWLQEQPADGIYNYRAGFDCLLCQYYRAKGLRIFAVEKNHYLPRQGERVPLPENFNIIAMGGEYGDGLRRCLGRSAMRGGVAEG